MTSTQILLMIAELVGGLAFFLYGMNVMSGGLEKTAGGGLERMFKRVARNDFLGFLTGAGITIAIQSSSALTVMLVGLVNSGILNFTETYGMIMGSHVGTTLTAWILTMSGISGDHFFLTLLKPTTFAPIVAFIGIFLYLTGKNGKKKNIGMILLGFAILMAGMQMMSQSMNGFREDPSFQALLTAFTSPILAFAVSALFTGVIQSSAATVAIVQALALAAYASANPITFQVAIPLVVGANVGTCMTALISGLGTSKEAKRVVAMHIYINSFGGLACIALLYAVMAIRPDLVQHRIGIIGVATVHSMFNILNTLVFIPLKKPVAALCRKTIRQDGKEKQPIFLDERIFNNTPLALAECLRLTNEMAESTRGAILNALKTVTESDPALEQSVAEAEAKGDQYEDKLGTYLVRLSKNSLSAEESHAAARLLHSISDFERISDHALKIVKLTAEAREKRIHFSGAALEELDVIVNALAEIVNRSVDSFIAEDSTGSAAVEPLEQVIDKLRDELRARHVARLQKGECSITQGFIFTDLLSNFGRVSDHCSNLAVSTMQLPGDRMDAHRYLSGYKKLSNQVFADYYRQFEEKYQI